MSILVPTYLSTGNDTEDDPQLDPNASLSGKNSVTRIEELESTLTAIDGSLPKSVFIDDTQVTGAGFPLAPTAGVETAPDANFGNYNDSEELIHWWRITFDPDDDTGGGIRGKDFGSIPIDFNQDFTDALGPGDQIIAQPQNSPDTMFQQRSCYPRDAPFNGMLVVNPAGGFGTDSDELTVSAWIFPTAVSTAPSLIFNIDDQVTSSSLSFNSIYFGLGLITGANDGQLAYSVKDNTGTVLTVVGTTVLPINQWSFVTARHKFSTPEAELFIDGVKETLVVNTVPSGMTIVDAGALDAAFGAVRGGTFWQFDGNIHSIMMWNKLLSDAAILELSGFGDGPELPAPPTIDHSGKWMTFEDPFDAANDNEAREIAAFNGSTGEFTIQGDLPANAVFDDTYRLWPPNGIFSAYSFTQNDSFADKHRLLFLSNETGVSIADWRMYVVPIDPGPLICEVAQGFRASGLVSVLGITNEEQTPRLDGTAAADSAKFVQGTSGVERFSEAFDYASAQFTSPLSIDSLFGTTIREVPTFIRLRFHLNDPIPLAHRAVFQVFGDNGLTGASKRQTSFLIVVDVPGPDTVFVLGPDRKARLGGGVRLLADVRNATGGALIPGRTVVIQKDFGAGTLGALSADPPVTDEINAVRAVYLSPTDPIELGATIGAPIVFDNAGGTITRSDGGDFTVDGFATGETIRITGTSDNDGDFLVASVVPLVITVTSPALTDETATSAIFIAPTVQFTVKVN